MTTKSLEIRARNLNCEHVARAVQSAREGSPGLATLRVHPNAAKVSLTCEPDTTSAQDIWPAEPPAEPGGLISLPFFSMAVTPAFDVIDVILPAYQLRPAPADSPPIAEGPISGGTP